MIEEKANSPRGERHTHTQVYGKRKSLNIPRRTNFFAIIYFSEEIGEMGGGDLPEEVRMVYTERGSISVHARFGQISSYDETKPDEEPGTGSPTLLELSLRLPSQANGP